MRERFATMLLLAVAVDAQNLVTLEKAAARSGRDSVAVYENRHVTVRGQVASVPIWALGTYYVSVTDATDHGLLLRGERNQFTALQPGDAIEAEGIIQSRGGLPMLAPSAIRKVSSGTARPPKEMTIAEVATLRYVGMPVHTRATVKSIGENLGGKVVEVSDRGDSLAVFLPKAANSDGKEFSTLRSGDSVQLTGLVTQYAPEPPYDGSFQLMLGTPEDVQVIPGGSGRSPILFFSALGVAALMLLSWWLREKRREEHRQSMRAFHALSEAIIAATSRSEIAEKLVTVLPTVTRATGVRMYLLHRSTKSLESVQTSADPDPMAVPLDTPPDGLSGAAAVCLRNRTLLNVPDTRRSPFVKADGQTNLPRSAMFIPLAAHNEVIGVLEVSNSRRLGYFTPEEQALAQHLANQAAASLKLQEQQAMREQVLHSEKLAATGQLISGVAGELRAPIENILQRATSLAQYRGRPVPERDLRELANESLRASEIVSRLVSFARPEDSAAAPVDVNAVVAGLMQFREPEWKTLGLRVQNRLAPAAALVLGAQGQIEQVFLNLLVEAEQRASQSEAKTLTVSSSTIARRAVVEISYSGVAPDQGLGVYQGIVQSHGGEIRSRAQSGTCKFEIDFPLASASEENTTPAETRKSSSPLTVMVVDTDPSGQRQLLGLLSMRGHRVVPVPFEEAADLAQRLRFDAVMWTIRAPGSRWSEFHERIRTHAGAFVLLSDGYDPELAKSLEESGGFLLGRPIKVSDLENVLLKIEARSSASTRRG